MGERITEKNNAALKSFCCGFSKRRRKLNENGNSKETTDLLSEFKSRGKNYFYKNSFLKKHYALHKKISVEYIRFKNENFQNKNKLA